MILGLMAGLLTMSCEKSPALKGGDADITASIKSGIENAAWSGKETVAVSANGDTPVVVQAEKGSSFAMAVTFAPSKTDGTVYAVSPYDEEGASSWISVNADEAVAVIPTSQTTVSKFCDAGAMLLFAKTTYTGGVTSVKALTFEHVVAYAKIKLTGAPEPIEKAVVKFAKKSAGEFTYRYASETWTESENSIDKITVKANENGELIFAVAPTGEQEVEIELSGAATGAKYSVKQTVNFAAGKLSEISADLSSAISLYIVGTAVGTEDPASAKPLTRNSDGSFTYTGTLAADSWYQFIFDQKSLTPLFSMGDAFNHIKYSTKTTAAAFENKYAGKYTLTVYPSKAHLAVKRNFDHVIAADGGVNPMDDNFDGERTFGPYNTSESWNWNLGIFGINAIGKIVYGDSEGSGITINNDYKLCGENSLCLEVTEQAEGVAAGDGQIYRNGNNGQPKAEWNKTYTVILQMLYEGEEDTKKIPVICEGALGAHWTVNAEGGYDFTDWVTDMGVELQNGVPTLVQAQFLGNGAWGGCFNFYIRPAGTGAGYKLYLDGIQIGYDD